MARLSKTTTEAVGALEDMWRKVDSIKGEILKDALVIRPPNSITIREYMERYDLLSRNIASYQLERMVSLGKMNKVKVLLPNAKGSITSVSVYVIKT